MSKGLRVLGLAALMVGAFVVVPGCSADAKIEKKADDGKKKADDSKEKKADGEEKKADDAKEKK